MMIDYAISSLMLSGRPFFFLSIVHRDNNEVYRWRTRAHEARVEMCTGADKVMASDTWQLRQLLLMPTTWWKDVATLLNFIVEHWCVPNQWCSCQVALIPKAREGTLRQFSICASTWRLLTSMIHSQLSNEVDGWAGNGLKGAASD